MQGTEVRLDRIGDVAVLVLAHPPVNALSDAVRAGVNQALQAALADPGVRAIVIRAEGRGFSAGADIAEFGRVGQGKRPGIPNLGDLCLAIENAPKPVIAAIHGMALGGGLELALAAHYRVATAAAVLGLPEVNLGLLPGAGGTQRLPRLVGADAALRMMLTGQPITAAEALALGLIDRIAPSDLIDAALAMATEGLPPRPTGAARRGLVNPGVYLASTAEARKIQAQNRLPAAARIVDCVEEALLFPLAQGLMAEATAFADLVATPEAAGLRHAFFTERRAMQLPAPIAAAGIKPVTSLGLWGLAEGVVDLTFQALTLGMRVVLAGPDRAGLVSALEAVAERQDAAVQAGLMTTEALDADWARLATSTLPQLLDGVDLILRTADAPPLPQAAAGLGAAGPDVAQAITVAAGPGGLAELSLTRDAAPELAARLVALARRLTWRLVVVGPGGPIELGLRQALDAAIDYLGRIGITAQAVAAAQAAWSAPKAVALPPNAAHIIAICLAALAAEGARMLQDGRARRPLEIDAVALLAGLVPRWEGGPMFQADRRGLLLLRQDLIALAEDAAVFLPPELIDRMIADGQSFANLNGVPLV